MLHEFYEWPKNRQESNIFFREVFRLKGFWGELGKRMTFNFFGHGLDIGVKLAVWQFFYGSTASYQEYSDWNAFKNMICGALAALPTCWTAVPGETASRAYYADKTWPLELRRNYKSPMNALLRIPFEEGPSYLFKGGLPIMLRDAIFFSYFFSIYAWLKNKLFFFWVYNDFSYDWIKLLMMSFSWASGCFVSYPAYFAREMVDLWPKERGGHCTWKNSYYNAIQWAYHNQDMFFVQYFSGYWQYMAKKGVPVFIAAWIADNVGMFTNVSDSHYAFETVWPYMMENS